MRVSVDLLMCQSHGQCALAAPAVFALDENGKLTFRRLTTDDIYVSDTIDESLRDDVEEAADICPVQAITVLD